MLLFFVLSITLISSAVFFFVLPYVFQLHKPRNIIIVSQDLAQSEAVVFVHISPQTEKTILAVLNGSDRVEVLGGYGQYSIQSLYALVQLDGKGDHFVRAAFSHALGVMIDEVVLVSGLSHERARTASLAELLQPVVFQGDSGLRWRDRLELYFAARTYRRNEIRPSEARQIAPLLGAHPLISETQARSCQIAVVNTTSTPGLASGVGQLLEKSGAIVVRVASDTTAAYEKTGFVIKETSLGCAELALKAAQVFPYVPTIEYSADLPQRYRADMVIMAGSDLAETARLAE